ncbi:hypothetical protein CAEBREN_20080 [Caenorhabditis brenneri]|uniref:SPK domain-containing protein n=1 Tax=Caenorhabditis brenneri TaxID=135651 RepID=G0MGM4_CAEBE|nr:hypothetical protein CAEBREN_20080 [Caenorhabditis brenneri]
MSTEEENKGLYEKLIEKAISCKNTAMRNTNLEKADILKFLIEKTETDCRPFDDFDSLHREFTQKFNSNLDLDSFRTRFQYVKKLILLESDFSFERKIKLLFVSRCGISSEYHKELLEKADVQRDDKNAIVRYVAKDGSLILEAEKSKQKKKAKRSIKTEAKKRQIRDSEDGNDENDLDETASKPPPKKRCSALNQSSSSGAGRSQPLTPAPAQNEPDSTRSPAPTTSAQPVQNSVIADAREQAPPAPRFRPVKSEDPDEIVFNNRRAPQPSVPQTIFFLKLFRGLVDMIEPYKQDDVLNNIDDVMRTYERIGDSDISLLDVVPSINLSISNILRHSTSIPQKNVRYQSLLDFLKNWKMFLKTLHNDHFNEALEKVEVEINNLHVEKFCPIDQISRCLQTILDTVSPPAF